MPGEPRTDTSKKARAGKKAAGATGGATAGTLFVLFADSLPEHSPWKRWILAAAPTVTVGLTALSSWGIAGATDYWNRRKDKKKLEKGEKEAQNLLKAGGLSDKNKADLASTLEKIQEKKINNIRSALGLSEDVVQEVEISAEKTVDQTLAAKKRAR